jgi:hypothetical protein
MKSALPLIGVALLAACSQPLPVADNTTAGVNGTEATTPAQGQAASTTVVTPETPYVGRWTGVEGLYLDVSARPGGGVAMEMQWDLDNKGDYEGTVTPEGIRFLRGGVEHLARRTDGDATGLKYLAGKQDCLTLKPGEGYCRG